MNEFYIILTGVLLRIAIPAMVFVGLALLLSRMDAGWKRESQFLDKVPAPTQPVQEDCWVIKKCSSEEMAGCPAVKSDEPCWHSFRQKSGLPDPACLECEVFHTSVAPIPELTATH